MNYDFTALNDKEFEQLARDILNECLGLDLQDFKPGKDQGRDLRFSTGAQSDEIVVQAKHYVKTGIQKLIRDLKTNELAKVKRLKPSRYIVVTSVPLSAADKDIIYEIFRPFMLSANDVLGKEDLNKYLAKMPGIETKWFKLWLTSSAVLNKVLNNAVLGRSHFIEDRIRRTIDRYVQGAYMKDALDVLLQHQFILITGQPGVGKTTLADMLTYFLLSKKCQLVYIDNDIKEAEALFSPDPKARQVFYFDDFLGANYLELVNPKSTESAFVHFIERIKTSKTKYLILTTRTNIYHDAADRYEKMKRVNLDTGRKEISLGNFTDLEKGQILYNHIYHSALNEAQKNEIIDQRKYWKIIDHPNYNPRLIEFVTNPANIPAGKELTYFDFVFENLNNPHQVWKYAYEQQWAVEERLLINAVFSLPGESPEHAVKEVFEALLRFEMKHYHFRPRANPYQSSLRRLLDGILHMTLNAETGERKIAFMNASIKDFLLNYFRGNEEEAWKLMRGSVLVQQFENYRQHFFMQNTELSAEAAPKLERFSGLLLEVAPIMGEIYPSTDARESGRLALRLAFLLDNLYNDRQLAPPAVREFISRTIMTYPLKHIDNNSWKYYIGLVQIAYPDDPVYRYVKADWDKIVRQLLFVSTSESEYDAFLDLFQEYQVNYRAYLARGDHRGIIEKCAVELALTLTEEAFNRESNTVFSKEDWDSLKIRVRAYRQSLFEKFGLEDRFYEEDSFFRDKSMHTVISRNEAGKRLRKFSSRNFRVVVADEENEASAIERLFSGSYDEMACSRARNKAPF
jgi:hypothetical protein